MAAKSTECHRLEEARGGELYGRGIRKIQSYEGLLAVRY
jgi:hypothetical protein